MKKPIKPKAPALPKKVLDKSYQVEIDPYLSEGTTLASWLEEHFPGISLADLIIISVDRDYEYPGIAIGRRVATDNPLLSRQMELYQIKKDKYDTALQKYKRDIETYYRAKVAEAEEELKRLLREGE